MPGWNIHLEAGERLAQKLNFSEVKKKEFLFGCILPDINNGYINKVKKVMCHEKTHYAYDQKSSLNFYAENKAEIDRREPVFFGYLFHLYTDGFFNYDFFRTIKHSPMGDGLNYDEKQRIKHHDFPIYDSNFTHRIGVESREEAERLAKKANMINIPEITAEDIEDIERILTSGELKEYFKGEDYMFYTKERLDELMTEMIESFSKDYLGGDNA